LRGLSKDPGDGRATVEATPAVTAAGRDREEYRYVVRLVALFCAGWAVIYADRTALYPLLKVVAEEFTLSGTQTGLITATYFALYITGQLCAGILADRFGIKGCLVWSGMLTAVGMLGFALGALNYQEVNEIIAWLRAPSDLMV